MSEGSSIDRLPQEVINTNILTRLPVKPLLLCRSVCKDWQAVIDDPDFSIKHFNTTSSSQNPSSIILIPTHRPKHTDGLYLVEEEADSNFIFSKIDLPYADELSCNYLVVGCSHGLICFSSFKTWGWCTRDCSFYICNPITFEYFKLPAPDTFDFRWDGLSCGFGFVSSTEEFKLVKIFNLGMIRKVMVYMGGSNSWKNIPCAAEVSLPTGKGAGLFFTGSILWIEKDAIVSFDLEFETFGVIPLPELHLGLGLTQRFLLAVLGGCLCLSFRQSPDSPSEIWVMKEYKVRKSWNRLVVITNNVIGGIYVYAILPLYFGGNGDLVVLCNFKFLVSYNQKTTKATPLWDDDFRTTHAYSSTRFEVFPYLGTLISPKPACLVDTITLGESKKWQLQVYS